MAVKTAVVNARTAVAVHILSDPALLQRYQANGGLKKDLESIRDHGLHAEAMQQAQSQAQGAAAAATVASLLTFSGVQAEYKKLMAILTAVKGDLAESDGNAELIKRVEQILKDETAVVITVAGDSGKTAKKSATFENIRAEIRSDVEALLAFAEVHPLLQARGVDATRMRELLAATDRIQDAFTAKRTKADARKGATVAGDAAVADQSRRWVACRRLIGALAPHSEALRGMLKKAANG